MSLQLIASRHQLADLRRIVEIGSDSLAAVLHRLNEISTPTIRPQELLDTVSEVLPSNDAECLVRQLLSLHGLSRQSRRTVPDVINGVRTALEQQGEDASIALEDWSKIENLIQSLVEDRMVRLTATAIELAYDYANLLRRTKILTDVRPLYDESAETIEAAVVSYTLRLHYDNNSGEHDLSIALDESDIRGLIVQCNRALKKAETARNLVTDKCNIAVTVSGETTDG